jgi:K+-dependent Na+/Ca+ exchanger-like protein
MLGLTKRRRFVGARRRAFPVRVALLTVVSSCYVAANWYRGSWPGEHNNKGMETDVGRTLLASNSTHPDQAYYCETLTDAHHGEYPNDMYTCQERQDGMLVLHVLGVMYTFLGLALVCDEFFEPALDAICKFLDLSDDVGGATFMAAGSSAPELFTSIMGVFVAKSDVGIGTIIGSAVFNILIIIGCVAFAAPGLILSWYPLTRDSICYSITIICLICVVFNGKVEAWEAIICLLLYIGYVVVMYFNERTKANVYARIEKAAQKEVSLRRLDWQHFLTGIAFLVFISFVIVVNLVMVVADLAGEDAGWLAIVNHICSSIFLLEFLAKLYAFGIYQYWQDPYNAFDGILVFLIVGEYILQLAASLAAIENGSSPRFVGAGRSARLFRVFRIIRALRVVRVVTGAQQMRRASLASSTTIRVEPAPPAPDAMNEFADTGLAVNSSEGPNSARDSARGSDDPLLPTDKPEERDNPAADEKEKAEEEKQEDDEDDDPFWPFTPPEKEKPEDEAPGPVDWIMWAITLPMGFFMVFTIPDCRREYWSSGKLKNAFVLTFINSILWIGFLSYFMVWFGATIGDTLGIPSTIMGLTFLAAGTSIPDTISSVHKAQEGKGDMAVSNSIGSNIFDILVGLGVPWFIQTVFVDFGGYVPIQSDNMTLNVMLLFVTLALVISSIHFSHWHLSKTIALYLFSLYVAFVTLMILLENGDI